MKFIIVSVVASFINKLVRLVLILVSLFTSTQMIASESLDSIVAVVNDGVILRSELDRFYKRVRRENRNISEYQALDTLVIRKIQLDTAEDLNIYISERRVEDYIRNYLTANRLTPQEHATRLEANEENYPAWRAEVKEFLLIEELQRQQLSSYVRINPSEIDSALTANPPVTLLQSEFDLIHLFIGGDWPEEAEIFKITDFLEENSDREAVFAWQENQLYEDMRLNYFRGRKPADLPDQLIKEVILMQTGDIRVIYDQDGLHIVKALDIRYPRSLMRVEYNLLSLSLPTNIVYDHNKREVQIRDIFAKLERGERFAELAGTYGDGNAPYSSYNLEWVGEGVLPAELKSVVTRLRIGDYSKPFRTDDGWHIVLLTDKRNRDITLEYLRERVYHSLLSKKLQLTLPFWLNDIRNRAHIEYRLTRENELQ